MQGEKYHKIQTVFKRDPETNHKTLLMGDYSLPAFDYLQHNLWQFTEKVDGTNIRIGLTNGVLQVGGRTDNAQIPSYLLPVLQNHFAADKLEPIFPENNFCLYGEGYGAKIQKGGGNYKPDGVDFVLFDVNIGGTWLRRESVEDIAAQLGIGCVPIIGQGTLSDMVNIVKQGFSSQWGSFRAEGIVARPVVEMFDRMGRRVITKLKCKDFPS
jgi:hypothetical protein